ncbi:DUF6538 domain-containing protein [Thioalkalivibrio sp. ALgr3]|uniref:DUF6538 domain-containing protein n=1 Tax=Thioalkalivibrio sp. ALgr3 TaxID=1239292 RepID=UPI0003795DD5|nr:DUF6538 domain-containing protein [Thioalkalivibrio sp. ALgr3]
MPKNLKRRYQTWYARLEVPGDVRELLGRYEFVQSLKTDSLKEAERRKWPLLDRWQAQIDEARGQLGGDPEAIGWRYALAQSETDADGNNPISHLLVDRAEEIEYRSGYKAAKDFYDRASGNKTEIWPLALQWLSESDYPAKSETMHRQGLTLLSQKHPCIEDIDRKAAAAFIRQDLAGGDRSRETVKRMMSTFRQFWRWLDGNGYTEGPSPWTNQTIPKNNSNGSTKQPTKRRPYNEPEVRALLVAVDATAQKHPADPLIVRLMAVTGMRLDDACSLGTDDVAPDSERNGVIWLNIQEGKTENATRKIPVTDHTTFGLLKNRLEQRIEDGHAWFFPECQPKNRNGSASAAVSKRLARHARQHVSEDKALAPAHGLRHWVQTRATQSALRIPQVEKFLGRRTNVMGLDVYYTPDRFEFVEVAQALELPEECQGFPLHG